MSKRLISKIYQITNFGNLIRSLRLKNKKTLKEVSAFLKIDSSLLSKIEKGRRMAKRELIKKLSEYYDVKEEKLLISWLSDKLLNEVSNEDLALEALKVAEEKMNYIITKEDKKSGIIKSIKNILKKDGRVLKAWLFGSVARNEDNSESDIDIMIEFNKKKNYSLFDLSDIAYNIEQKTKRKVDIVEKGYIKDFAVQSAENDLILIYE